jgi:hypothetical protein
MATWTSSQDVLDVWVGDNKPEDVELINALILKAETIILATYPQIQARIDAGTLNINVVIYTVAEMVEAVLRNPEQKSSYSYTTGPYAESASFTGSKKGIYLTNEQKKLLAPNSTNKAKSIDLLAGSNAVYDAAGVGYVGYFNKNHEWVIISRGNVYPNDLDNIEDND